MRIFFALCVLTILIGCGNDPHYDAHTPTKRCGPVIKSFVAQELGGYKYGSYDQPHVVFYDTSSKRNEDVEVSFDELANAQAGDTVCYEFCTHYNCNRHYHP